MLINEVFSVASTITNIKNRIRAWKLKKMNSVSPATDNKTTDTDLFFGGSSQNTNSMVKKNTLIR